MNISSLDLIDDTDVRSGGPERRRAELHLGFLIYDQDKKITSE